MVGTAEAVAVAVEAAPLLFGLLFAAAFAVAGVRLLRTGLGVAVSDPIPAAEVYHAEGTVEVEGTAEPAVETLSAPESGTECLGYVHEVAVKMGSRHDPALVDNSDPSLAEDDHRGGDWTTVERNRDLVPFYVRDDSGRVLVGDDADIYPGEDERIPDEDEDGRAHRESRIEPGDEVHVYGTRRDVVEAREGFPDERVFVGSDDGGTAKVTVGTERDVIVSRALIGGFLTLFAGGATLLILRELLGVVGLL